MGFYITIALVIFLAIYNNFVKLSNIKRRILITNIVDVVKDYA